MFAILSRFLSLTLVLSVFQLYVVSYGDMYISIQSVLCLFILAICLTIAVAKGKCGVDMVSLIYLLTIGFTLFAVLWSPDKMLAVRSAIYISLGYGGYLASSNVCARSEAAVVRAITWFVVVGAVHSIIVIFGKFNSDWKLLFLGSPVAHIFIKSNVLSGFLLDPNNNVIDPFKSGGFFLNANAGAVFSEVMFYCAIAIIPFVRVGRIIWCVPAIHFLAVICSGSKSAMALAFFTPVLAYIYVTAMGHALTYGRIVKTVVQVLFAAVVFFAIYEVVSVMDIGEDARVNAERRGLLLEFAFNEFLDSPLLGMGFGGWAIKFYAYGQKLASYGLNGDMPAHNFIVIAWAQGGIALAGMYIINFLIFFKKIHKLVRCGRRVDSYVGGVFFALMSAILIHSMGDNILVFEEAHTAFPLAVIMGWLQYRTSNKI
jgi:hypothetical protein